MLNLPCTINVSAKYNDRTIDAIASSVFLNSTLRSTGLGSPVCTTVASPVDVDGPASGAGLSSLETYKNKICLLQILQ